MLCGCLGLVLLLVVVAHDNFVYIHLGPDGVLALLRALVESQAGQAHRPLLVDAEHLLSGQQGDIPRHSEPQLQSVERINQV